MFLHCNFPLLRCAVGFTKIYLFTGESPSKFAPKKYQALSKTLSISTPSPTVSTSATKSAEANTFSETKEKPCERKENSEALSPTRYSKRLRGMTEINYILIHTFKHFTQI